MGHAIDSLAPAAQLLKDNKLLIPVTLVAAFFAMLLSLLLSLIPLLGSILSGVLVTPFLLTGVVGMVYAAHHNGTTSLSDFTNALSDHYLSMVGAYAIANLASILGLILGFIVIMFLGVGTLGAAGESAGASMGVLLITFLFILVLTALAILFFTVVQFLDVAIIVDDHSATSSFTAAWELVRNNLISVFGYTLLRSAAMMAAYLIPVIVFVILVALTESFALPFAIAALLGLALIPIAATYLFTYHVTYYTAITESTN